MADEKSIMERIREANRAYTTGLDDEGIKHWVTIYLMGKAYTVPADLTIMQAIEYAGYQFIRGAGCRAGFCGACATVYRMKDDYKLQTALACQTRVEDGMYLVQIPFTPAEKASYDINEEDPDEQVLLKYYPEIARCVSCNTCTKACPQELEVMDYVQAALRGDLQKTAELSFDCIQCGLCALRCPAEICQYHVGQLARRMYGKYGLSEPSSLTQRIQEIEQGRYEDEFDRLMDMDRDELEKLYNEREKE
ncbi:MAG: 4Fe-4S dicluster domain-containing protein [Anaerolineales bacterium]